jgi:hypothetical protein
MPAISTFRSAEPALVDVLKQIHIGETQLPDYQRGWVWDDDHIRSLLASVSLAYPIGAVMLLETGGNGVRFKSRPVEGTSHRAEVKPKYLILDGQQRMTSLFLALQSGKAVPTRTSKGDEIQRGYYLDIAKCLDPNEDRLDAVRSVPAERKITSDFGRKVELDVSTPELEYAAGLFPVDLMYNNVRFFTWQQGYQKYWQNNSKRFQQLNDFQAQVWLGFQQYRIPTIELLSNTPKEAVCQVFEKVNTGGVVLTVFELMTATFAADDYLLRDDWEARKKRLVEYEPLRDIEATDFLSTITLLASYKRKVASTADEKPAVSCKRRDVLKLTLEEYKANAQSVEDGLINASRLLTREKVFDIRVLPYQTQFIPLGAICTALGDRFENESVKQKLTRWYWCGVFGEMYGGANESRYAFDVEEVLAWVAKGTVEPRTIRDCNFAPVRLLSLQSRLSAAYKGLMVQLMQVGSLDFVNGDPIELTTYYDNAIDIHHIFPKAYCEKKKYDRTRWNSVINKAALTARSNRLLGGYAPSTYLASLQKNEKLDPERIDGILCSHLIDPKLLRADDFDGFVRERAIRLLDLIEKATGKQVSGRDSQETVKAFGVPLTVKKS